MRACLILACKPAQFQRAQKDAGEHRSIETAGIGVAQRGMVAAEQRDVVGQEILGAMAEGEGGPTFDDALVEQVGEVAVPRDLAEADHDADFRKRCDFGGEMRRTVADLLGRWLVAGRGTADDGTDPDLTELQAIIPAGSDWFAGKAKLVEDRIHEVTGAVAGKGAPGAVGSMGAWSETHDEDARVGVAEARDRPRPVFLVAVRFAASLADAANVGDESRTTGAVCNVLLELRDVLLTLIENGEGMF